LCHAIKARSQHPRQGLRWCAHWRHPHDDQPWLSRASRCLCHAAHASASSFARCVCRSSASSSAAPGAAATPSAAATAWPCQHVSASGSVTVARRQTIGIDDFKSIHAGASRARGSGCAAWSSRAPQAFLWDGHQAAACQGLHEIGFPPAARDAALPTQSPSCLRAWSSGNVRPRVLVAVLVGHECLVEQGPRGLDDATVEQVMRDSVPSPARSARIG